VLTAKVMLAPNVRGNAGIVFRVNSPGPGGDEMHGYYTGFNERELQLGKMNGRWHPLATVALKPGEVVGTNLLRAHAEGNRLRVWLNPTSDTAPPRFDVRDEVSPILHGSIGVRVHEAIARFDDIEVVPSAVNDSAGQAAPAHGFTDATGKEADRPKNVELRFGTIAEADRFVKQVNGVRSYSEWQQPPLTYWGPAENGKAGSITYYFDFGMPTAQIRLQTTTNCWNFQATPGGSGRGTSSVFVSANGNDWVPLRDDVRKKVWGQSLVIDENLPSSLKGTSKLWVRVELLQEQTPSNYATAQFGRSDGTSKESFLRVIATPNSKP
jgi:hypothetical protein